MEGLIIKEILSAMGEGNPIKGAGLVIIFLLIWLEVRGMKKQMKLTTSQVEKIQTIIEKSFAAGETRFTQIERRLTVLEEHKPIGGENGQSLRPEGLGSNH